MARSDSITQYFKPGTPIASGVTFYSTTDTTIAGLVEATLNWETTSQSIANNSSTVQYSVSLKPLNLNKLSASYVYDPFTYMVVGTDDKAATATNTYPDIAITVDNTELYTTRDFTATVREGEPCAIYTGTATIAHSTDGTKSATLDINIRIKNFYTDNGDTWYKYNNDVDMSGLIKLSATLNLDAIPRHAIIDYSEGKEVQNFNDEVASVAISYAVPSGMTGYIYLSLDGNKNTESTHLEAVTGVGTRNYSFSANDRRQLWSILDQGLENKQVRFFIKTTNENGAVFREPSNWVNLTIVNYMPTLNPSVVDSNPITKALTGDPEKLIRYASTAKFTTGAQAKKHYSISTESCANGGGNPVYGATGEIPNVASNYFTFSATDNAGRRVQTGHEIPEEYGYWIPYVKLTCTATPTEMTADGDVAVTLSGKYFKGNFSTTRPNKMYLSYELSKNNEEPTSRTIGEITPQVEGSDYTYTFIIPDLEYLSVYDLTIKVSDEILTEGTVAHTILASTPIFDWGRTDFNFNVPVTITEGEVSALVPSIVEQGTDSGWNYRKWSDGLYECWQRKVIPTMIGNDSSAAGWYSSGAIQATNISYPITFVEPPTVNISLSPTTNTWALIVPGSTPGTTEETGIYQLLATYSHEFANRDYIFNYNVRGRWK